MTNKLIHRAKIENQTFQLNLRINQEQLHLNQFTHNISSFFIKMNVLSTDRNKDRSCKLICAQ